MSYNDNCDHIIEGSSYCPCYMCVVCGDDLNICNEHSN